ncbi:MAG: hypothetical protein ACHQM6_09900 [Candidatus Kapaibacterium sp.]
MIKNLIATLNILFISSTFAQPIPRSDTLTWKHYSGGFPIDLPSLFRPGIITNSGIQWFENTDTSIHGEYSLSVDLLAEHTVTTSADIKKSFEERREIAKSNGDKITYELLKPNFFIVSGTLKDVDDDFIWYCKGINHKGRYYELYIRYMPPYKIFFDSILPRIATSFH